MRSTHAGRLERWLGQEEVDRISQSMRGWYGPPILVSGVPSSRGVWVGADGDFIGRVDAGDFMSLAERCADKTKRLFNRVARKNAGRMNAGFSSLGDLIAEATVGGKRAEYYYQKLGTAGVIGGTNSLWRVGNQPVAAAAPPAAPAGAAPTSVTQGALPLQNPQLSGDTQHLVRAETFGSVISNTLMLYDRIFEVNKTMSSTANETVTGVPTRYQNLTPGQPDSVAGNFLFFEVQTALAATAHNWNAQYTDNAGDTAQELPTLTGVTSAAINRLDHNVSGQWFAPLAAGDSGIRNLTRVTCSASVTGAIAVVIGRPIAFLPVHVANLANVYDGVNSAFNLTRIFNDACLAFLEVTKPATTATNYSGGIATVSG